MRCDGGRTLKDSEESIDASAFVCRRPGILLLAQLVIIIPFWYLPAHFSLQPFDAALPPIVVVVVPVEKHYAFFLLAIKADGKRINGHTNDTRAYIGNL